MRKIIVSLLMIAAMIACVSIISCKKKVAEPKATLDGQVQQHNTDANNIKSESNAADNDINDGLNTTAMGNRVAGIQSSVLCGVTIDTSQIANKIIILKFDSVTYCSNPTRIRSGKIKVQLTSGNYWHDAGSVLTETFINFRVSYPIANTNTVKYINFNGMKTLKNMNGNNWFTFLAGTSTFKYQERALGIQVDFDGGLHATWNSARMTEWSWMQANTNPKHVPTPYISFTATGDTTISGHPNTDSWGTNRFGYDFVTYYTNSWVSDTYCGLWSPTSGQLIHHVNNNDYTFTAGVDPQGNASTGNCGYGFKVAWVGANGAQSVVISY